MADLALGVVKDIVKTGKAIKDALETLHRNDEVCQDLLGLVATTIAILSWLEEMELTSHPVMCGALMDLNGSLHRAHKLVTECQKKKVMHRFFAAGDMAKQLRRVRDDILLKMQLANLAITASMKFTRITTVRYDGAHPLPGVRTFPPSPGAAEMEIYSRHSTTGDARSEDAGAGIITMVTTGTEASFAPSSSNIVSSGLAEFSLSETVAMHHGSEENISGGSGYTVVSKRKIVIKMGITSDRQRSKAMQLAARAAGVISIAMDIGDGKVVVLGDGLDIIGLITALRRNVAYAELLSIGPASEPNRMKDEDMYTTVPSAMDRTSAEDTGAPELAAATGSHLVSAATPPADYSAQVPQLHRLPALEAPAVAQDDIFLATTDPPFMQHQPTEGRAPVRRRWHTFNMSRVHRSVRLPSTRRHTRMMPRTQPSSSSERSGARALQLLVACALCTLVLLLTSVWALH